MSAHGIEPGIGEAIDPRGLGKVAVLFGGDSAEREISIRSGTGMLAALSRQGVNAHAFDPRDRSLDALPREGFDRAVIALHGRWGEDGTVQGALELLRVPYTGSGPMASAIAMDKVVTKELWRAAGLPTPNWQVLEAAQVNSACGRAQLIAHLGLPLIIKPAHEGSTLGLTKVQHADQLEVAFERAAACDDTVLAEQFIAGRELTVALVGGTAVPGPLRAEAPVHALPVIEICAPDGNYDYQHKYFGDETRYLCPAPLPPAVDAQVRALTEQAFRLLRCRGWGRCDVMLQPDPDAPDQPERMRPMLLEMNTCPGMTDHSLVPMAARAAGMDYDELVLRLAAGAALTLRQNRSAQP
jgi:D-alanine-D-alanine ligase